MAQNETYHPLFRAVRQFVKKNGLFRPGQTVIAAVSGGADSMVMLDILAGLQQLWKLKIVVVHVNYGLRGKESNGDERLVRETAKRYGFPFYSKQSDTKQIAKKKKLSLQETAREIRYSFFETVKGSVHADAIVTAHHADDNAETMLFNLLRGGGLDGIAGIPVKRDSIVRPLLSVTRKEILNYAKEKKIAYRNDSSNAKDDYARNFLRNKIIPALQKRINPALTETLLHESELFRSASEFVDAEADNVYRAVVSNSAIQLKQWKNVHPFVQQSVIRRLLKELKIEPTFVSISSVAELAGSQKGTIVELDGNFIAERLSDSIIIRTREESEPFEFTMKKEGTFSANGIVLTVKKTPLPRNKKGFDASNEYVDAEKITFPLVIRTWKNGDRFIPLGMKGKKKLSDFFTEQKMTNGEKQRTPIVECGGEIVWVAGKRLDERFKITSTTTSTYQLTLRTNGKKNDHRQ